MPGYNFGYDKYYEENQLGANGSVEYTNTKGADATLTFKGTGMELYLRTQNANATSDPATEAPISYGPLLHACSGLRR